MQITKTPCYSKEENFPIGAHFSKVLGTSGLKLKIIKNKCSGCIWQTSSLFLFWWQIVLSPYLSAKPLKPYYWNLNLPCKENSFQGPVITGTFKKRIPGAQTSVQFTGFNNISSAMLKNFKDAIIIKQYELKGALHATYQ